MYSGYSFQLMAVNLKPVNHLPMDTTVHSSLYEVAFFLRC